MEKKVVILGTAHRKREPGKESPDGRLKEYLYSREIVSELEKALKDAGLETFVDFMPYDLQKNMQTPSKSLERQRELGLRVNEVNRLCRAYGKNNCCYVSIHVNAALADGNWHPANGWQVCVSPNCSPNSKQLAGYLFDAAAATPIRCRKPSLDRKYWEQSLYVLNRTLCPAVLTENMFQDNRDDVEYLLSDIGRKEIVGLHLEGILRYIDYLEK
jgi:N-acetylmuramoyl-L-alanine amidase